MQDAGTDWKLVVATIAAAIAGVRSSLTSFSGDGTADRATASGRLMKRTASTSPGTAPGSLRRSSSRTQKPATIDTGQREQIRVGHRLAHPLDAVIAGHQFCVPLGLAESINSKIAILRFQARGYRDPEYFKLKILQSFSRPHNPWARIVL